MTERLQYEEETEGGKNGEVDAEVEEGEETKVEKEEVRVQSARPVVAAGVVDTPRHSLQRCSKGAEGWRYNETNCVELHYV